jgi:hexosaminidase
VPPTEPYFGSSPSYLSVQTVYNFEPVPSSLPAAYTNYIMGAQCSLWGEDVPSPENVEFKLFPRLSAMAELTWTPAASKSYTSFTNRLVNLEQCLTQMGINYNHEAVTQIGSWTQPVSTTASTVSYTITPYVTQAGEIDVSFYGTSTSTTVGLNVYWVALLENGVQVDLDTYTGYAGHSGANLAYYVLHLPWYTPGATYTIQASIGGYNGTSTSGTVYLTNWN